MKQHHEEEALMTVINEDVRRISNSIYLKSEISCVQKEFEVLLIKEGIELISKHDEALKG